MELELGLGLPSYSSMISMKGLDLNCSYSNNSNGVEMEKNKGHGDNYQQFLDDDHGDDDEVESKGLSLLLWSGQQPNDEDDGRSERWRKLRHVNDDQNINEEEKHEIVGWPPINSLRKEYLLQRHHHGGGPVLANRRVGERAFALRNSMYVKVKMEGVAIGRKIDLRLCDSYQALTNTLINMFAKHIGSERRDGDYRILYQDRDGDWMLTGDVPWETFVESVQRMKILRNDY